MGGSHAAPGRSAPRRRRDHVRGHGGGRLSVLRLKGSAPARASGDLERFVFPTSHAVWVDEKKNVVGHESFHGTLKLLSGHLYVAGRLLAVHDALRSEKAAGWQHVAALRQCGLTVTFVVRECHSRGDAAAFSIDESEKRNSIGKMTDTFPAFALKALLILQDDSTAGSDIGNRMAVLEGKRVRYRGGGM